MVAASTTLSLSFLLLTAPRKVGGMCAAPAAKRAKVTSIWRHEVERREQAREKSIRVISINVAGLRSVLDPAKGKLQGLLDIVEKEKPDVLCMNEHKLKEEDVETVAEKLEAASSGYFPKGLMTFSCSTEKKGYSGVAVLLRDGLDESVDVTVPPFLPGEGRVLEADFDDFCLVATYVPNSGQDLKRLDYRIETWDTTFSEYIQSIKKPTVVVGDLNVAHLPLDIHNMYTRPNFDTFKSKILQDIDDQYTGLSQLKNQAGLTPRERLSFSKLLAQADMVDTFRHFHPKAEGIFSYFSQRAKQNRASNKGLRLDYVLASTIMTDKEAATTPTILDSFILQDDHITALSDHCAVGCDIRRGSSIHT